MQNICRKVHRLLLENNKTLAIAESCTTGLAAHLATRYPGSSRFFLLGISAYSNKAKESILKVPSRVIKNRGAVSKETAICLARNVRRLIRADLGIGITGIAGPGGGLPHKPVGTVFIAIATAEKSVCRKFLFRGSRSAVKRKAALKSLELLEKAI